MSVTRLAIPFAPGSGDHGFIRGSGSAEFIMIDIEPITFTVRFFEPGCNYGDPYKAVMTVQRMGHIALCSGLNGEISRRDYDEFFRQLEEMGVSEVHWLRQGTVKVQALRAVA